MPVLVRSFKKLQDAMQEQQAVWKAQQLIGAFVSLLQMIHGIRHQGLIPVSASNYRRILVSDDE